MAAFATVAPQRDILFVGATLPPALRKYASLLELSPEERAAEPDPIFAAIFRHRAAWQAFQDAPQPSPKAKPFKDPAWVAALAAEDAESEAGRALLATACATRAGLIALLSHLDWYVVEERDNLIRAAEFGAQFTATQANLRLALGVAP